MKNVIKRIPVLGELTVTTYWRILARRRTPDAFPGTVQYWQNRYSSGGNSGSGSYGRLADFKAEVLNSFVKAHTVTSVIEFGCGDGNQVSVATYPMYRGFDISNAAVSLCQTRFANDQTKSFHLMADYAGETAQLAISLDVIYHLVEDDLFEQYMRTLFSASTHYVIIYSSNTDDNRRYKGTYIRHRTFSQWVETHLPEWKLLQRIPNRYPFTGNYVETAFADFYVYEKAGVLPDAVR